MNQTKWIKEIIGEAVRGYGFKYEGFSRDGYINMWTFLRKKEDINQDITITIRDHETELSFMTNAYGRNEIHASGLIESNFKIDSANRWINWRDEEEFKQVLYHFREIILKKGFDILEEISRPATEERPKEETNLKLYREHKALNEEYRKRYGLENIESTVELMERISELIMESRDKAFAEVEELLMGMAAVYGEELVKKCRGRWFWNQGYKSCVIRGMRDQDGDERIENPLAAVINYWKSRVDEPENFIREFRTDPFDIIT